MAFEINLERLESLRALPGWNKAIPVSRGESAPGFRN
jgi:hypothetical protein